jgi:hypothetical protein
LSYEETQIKRNNTDLSGRVPGSFRDPSGFVFACQGQLFRTISLSYKSNYDHLVKSGLYAILLESGLLIPHEEINDLSGSDPDTYLVIRPERLPFVSYPYEWCFSQLKAAALLTLQIQKIAMDFGMSLKDCSAYNIQFKGVNPVMIDTLSFEMYQDGAPWVAYGQFCRHFLAPLTLMSSVDIRLNQLLRIYIDGLPLDLVSSLLPPSSWLSFSSISHLHLHAAARKISRLWVANYSHKGMSRHAFLGLIKSLDNSVKKLKCRLKPSEWSNYYGLALHSDEYFGHKKILVDHFLDRIKPEMVWDLGSNTGLYGHQAGARGISTIVFDFDPATVETMYVQFKATNSQHLLPLLLDLTNPSPAIGWANNERMDLKQRGPAPMVFALALIHHLAISGGVPLKMIAEFLAALSNFLVIEFVPETDDQLKKLLVTRKDPLEGYNRPAFEKAFGDRFLLIESHQVRGSCRRLYLMKAKI